MTNMRRALAVLAVTAPAAACVTEAYTVTQAGTVPAPRAMAYDGQPLDRDLRIEGRASTALTATEGGPDAAESGNFVARHHAGLAVRKRLGHGATDVGFELDTAFIGDSDPLQAGLGPRPDGSGPWSFTANVRHAVRLSDTMRLGVGLQLGLVDAPVRVAAAETERDSAALFAFALVPSWRRGPVTAFGSVTFASEVDVPRQVLANDDWDTPEVHADGAAVVVAVGTTYTFADGLRLTARLAQPTGSDAARYGAQADLTIGFDFGAPAGARPAAPPPSNVPPGMAPPVAPYPAPY